MSQCPTSSQMSQTHLRSQCCQIVCMHQCGTHECVGAQMFWNTLRHRLFHHLLCLRKLCLQPHHHGLHLWPVTRETPSVQQPVTPHVDVQPEFPPPASSADGDPMPLPHVDDNTTMGLSGTRNTVDFYRARYTSDHSTTSAVATHTGFSVTGGDEHVHR